MTKPRRRINQAGLDIIKHFEGLRLKAYICPAGVPTIGYGHTKHVSMGDEITKEIAEEMLKNDINGFERSVENMVHGVETTENQFSALVSLAFNIGSGALLGSRLLQKHISGDFPGAIKEFPKWRLSAGKVSPGLIRRRAAEAELYATPDAD